MTAQLVYEGINISDSSTFIFSELLRLAVQETPRSLFRRELEYRAISQRTVARFVRALPDALNSPSGSGLRFSSTQTSSKQALGFSLPRDWIDYARFASQPPFPLVLDAFAYTTTNFHIWKDLSRIWKQMEPPGQKGKDADDGDAVVKGKWWQDKSDIFLAQESDLVSLKLQADNGPVCLDGLATPIIIRVPLPTHPTFNPSTGVLSRLHLKQDLSPFLPRFWNVSHADWGFEGCFVWTRAIDTVLLNCTHLTDVGVFRRFQPQTNAEELVEEDFEVTWNEAADSPVAFATLSVISVICVSLSFFLVKLDAADTIAAHHLLAEHGYGAASAMDHSLAHLGFKRAWITLLQSEHSWLSIFCRHPFSNYSCLDRMMVQWATVVLQWALSGSFFGEVQTQYSMMTVVATSALVSFIFINLFLQPQFKIYGGLVAEQKKLLRFELRKAGAVKPSRNGQLPWVDDEFNSQTLHCFRCCYFERRSMFERLALTSALLVIAASYYFILVWASVFHRSGDSSAKWVLSCVYTNFLNCFASQPLKLTVILLFKKRCQISKHVKIIGEHESKRSSVSIATPELSVCALVDNLDANVDSVLVGGIETSEPTGCGVANSETDMVPRSSAGSALK
eukprot:gb/GEZN01003217.1/.p1 GENE.gb/GEZN01003217.1/~~gb/GEZN01003217.1/.p1  ORF type:complete len:663 (+),score=46.49 gb/GEZN01003217.1/:124-1989(+)